MNIAQLLRDSAERFNLAAEVVYVEWTDSIRSSYLCSPRDRAEFNRLVKIQMNQSQVIEIATAQRLMA